MSCILSRLQFQQEYGIVQRVNGFCEVPLAQVRDARPAQHLKTLVLEHLGGTVNLLLEALADNVKLLDRAVIVAELDVGLEREDDRDDDETGGFQGTLDLPEDAQGLGAPVEKVQARDQVELESLVPTLDVAHADAPRLERLPHRGRGFGGEDFGEEGDERLRGAAVARPQVDHALHLGLVVQPDAGLVGQLLELRPGEDEHGPPPQVTVYVRLRVVEDLHDALGQVVPQLQEDTIRRVDRVLDKGPGRIVCREAHKPPGELGRQPLLVDVVPL